MNGCFARSIFISVNVFQAFSIDSPNIYTDMLRSNLHERVKKPEVNT